jgi:hypothetical protein
VARGLAGEREGTTPFTGRRRARPLGFASSQPAGPARARFAFPHLLPPTPGPPALAEPPAVTDCEPPCWLGARASWRPALVTALPPTHLGAQRSLGVHVRGAKCPRARQPVTVASHALPEAHNRRARTTERCSAAARRKARPPRGPRAPGAASPPTWHVNCVLNLFFSQSGGPWARGAAPPRSSCADFSCGGRNWVRACRKRLLISL